jgi:hypothetical protein
MTSNSESRSSVSGCSAIENLGSLKPAEHSPRLRFAWLKFEIEASS